MTPGLKPPLLSVSYPTAEAVGLIPKANCELNPRASCEIEPRASREIDPKSKPWAYQKANQDTTDFSVALRSDKTTGPWREGGLKVF